LLSTEQIESIQEFAAAVGDGLDAIENDFDTKRRLVEQLDVQLTLAVEEGDRVVYARCLLQPDAYELHPIPQPAAGV
jgi:hypothetical protein